MILGQGNLHSRQREESEGRNRVRDVPDGGSGVGEKGPIGREWKSVSPTYNTGCRP